MESVISHNQCLMADFLLRHIPYFIICPFHDNLLNVKTENFYDRLREK